jgi:hypothetical protein
MKKISKSNASDFSIAPADVAPYIEIAHYEFGRFPNLQPA